MSKPGRMTISVPNELKARMEAVDEPVSWSAVACEAFRQKLADIVKRRGARDLNDALDRLRATKTQESNSRYDQGVKMAEEWAKQHATVQELERLGDFETLLRSRNPDGGVRDWLLTSTDKWTHAQLLAFLILDVEDDKEDSVSDARLLLVRIFGTSEPQREIIRGFIEGASRFWERVRLQL